MRANVTFVVLIYLKLQIDTHNVFLCRSVAFLGSVGPSCQQFFLDQCLGSKVLLDICCSCINVSITLVNRFSICVNMFILLF